MILPEASIPAGITTLEAWATFSNSNLLRAFTFSLEIGNAEGIMENPVPGVWNIELIGKNANNRTIWRGGTQLAVGGFSQNRLTRAIIADLEYTLTGVSWLPVALDPVVTIRATAPVPTADIPQGTDSTVIARIDLLATEAPARLRYIQGTLN